MVIKLKDSTKKRTIIKRGDQKFIGINLEIKNKIKETSIEGESQAETIDRVFTVNQQMTELLVTLVSNFEETPSKMADLMSTIPLSLKNLLNQLRTKEKKKNEKNEKNKD